MRILYFADGGSVHTLRWAGWFQDRGHEVHIASWTPGEDRRFVWHRLGRLREVSPGLVKVPVVRGVARERFLADQARRVVEEVRPDLVHGHYVDGYGHMASWSGFHPLVLTAWGSDIYGIAEQPARQQRATRRALALADAVTCDSADLRDAAVALGAAPERVHVFPFGVDVEVFRPGVDTAALRARLGIAEGSRAVVSPRSLRPIYNIATIVRAVAAVPGVTLVLKDYLGEPAYREEVRGLIEELRIGDRVVWAEAVAHEEMAAFYALADVVVSVAATDSSPVSVLEAMACGAPVVASDIPGVGEWITDGENGLLVEPGDAGALAAAIGRVLAMDDDTRAEWARVGRGVIVDRADYGANMAAVQSLYTRLTGDAAGGPQARSKPL